jgi:chemotaxis response regulator CheB
MELKSTYNCIVIDDEKLARELIEDLLKSYPNFNLIGKYKNTSLALNTLNSNFDVDVIFLDIQMAR